MWKSPSAMALPAISFAPLPEASRYPSPRFQLFGSSIASFGSPFSTKTAVSACAAAAYVRAARRSIGQCEGAIIGGDLST